VSGDIVELGALEIVEETIVVDGFDISGHRQRLGEMNLNLRDYCFGPYRN